MKVLLTAAAIFVGCALPATAVAQTAPDEATEKVPAVTSESVKKSDTATTNSVSEFSFAKAEPRFEPKTESSTEPKTDAPADKLFTPPPFSAKTDKVAEPKADQSSGSDWSFAFSPYVFAAGISGTVGARGRTLELDADFSGSVWDSLDLGLMGAFEIKKGRIVSVTDFMWIKLSQERDTPGRFYNTAKLGINLFVLDPEVGYRFVDSEKGSLDVMGGVRIWSVEANLNVTTGVLPGFDVSQRKTWAAPVVGVRGTYNVTQRLFLTGKFDIGGAGIGADLTTQLFGAVGYRITKHIALAGGYRWLQVDYDDEEGFIFDTQMQGLMFGARFSF